MLKVLRKEGPHSPAIWPSIQGEGFLIGSPTVFVRFAECSLGCSWCDTLYTAAWVSMNPQEVCDLCCQYESRYVCLTGGEPLQQKHDDLVRLAYNLGEKGRYTTMETAGTIIPENDLTKCIDFWTVSPKMPSAQAKIQYDINRMREWFLYMITEGVDFQIKVVIADEDDYNAAFEYFSLLGAPIVTRCNVVFQPECSVAKSFYGKLLSYVNQDFAMPNVRVLTQLHKVLGLP